jgi:hypothetical protein
MGDIVTAVTLLLDSNPAPSTPMETRTVPINTSGGEDDKPPEKQVAGVTPLSALLTRTTTPPDSGYVEDLEPVPGPSGSQKGKR